VEEETAAHGVQKMKERERGKPGISIPFFKAHLQDPNSFH
jgi:hypothetical protein